MLAAVLAVGGTASGSAPVTATCDPGRTNWPESVWDGTSLGGITPYKVRAEIEHYHPFVPPNADGPDARVQVWVMMARGTDHWAQFGWQQIMLPNGHDGGRWNWAQYTLQSGAWFDKFDMGYAGTVGTQSGYAIRRDYDSNEGNYVWTFKIEGTDVFSIHLGTWVPNSAQWFGEINSYGAQMPGDTGNHVRLDLVQWAPGTGVYQNADTPDTASVSEHVPPLSTAPFGHDKVDANSYAIWDEAC